MNQLTKILLEDILEIKNQDYIIYFDIDDTLTDYSNRLGNMIITDPETGEKRPIKASDTVDNKEFWTTAKWLPGSKEMLDFAKNNFSNVEILSAVPELSKANKELTGKRFFDAPIDGKIEWLNKNIGPIKTIWTKSGKEKAIYATPNTVLVDDKPENVIAFEKAGGIGILMDTPQNAVNKLKDLLEGKDMIKEGFMDNIKSKFSNFIKAVKQENKETKQAVSLLIKAAKGDIELSGEQKEQIGNQLKDVLKLAGLTAIATLPGGFIAGALIKLFKAEHLVTPSSFVNEVGEANLQPYKWEEIRRNSDYWTVAGFITDSETQYVINLKTTTYIDNDLNNYKALDIDFTAKPKDKRGKPSYKIVVNKGELYKVMSTITDIIKYYVEKFKAQAITYSPSKKSSEEDFGTQRDNLYKAFISKAIPNIKFEKDKESIVAILPNPVNEVGEANLKPYKWEEVDREGYYVYTRFTTDSETQYDVDIKSTVFFPAGQMESLPALEIEFSAKPKGAEGSSAKIVVNKGEMYRVMATIVDIIKKYLKKSKAQAIIYSPSKKSSEENFGTQRDNLYRAFISKAIPGATFKQSGDFITAILPNPVNEVGEANLQPYKWKETDREGYWVYTKFETESETQYDVDLKSTNYVDNDLNNLRALEVEFTAKLKNDWTPSAKIVVNKGELYRVMATVVDIVKTYIKKSKAQAIIYSPAKKSDEEDFGTQRDNLYRAFISKAFPGAEFKKYGNLIVVTLPNPVNETVTDTEVICDNCGWEWPIEDGGDDLYICHKCGHDNTPKKEDPFGLNELAKDFVKEVFEETWNPEEAFLSLSVFMRDNGMNVTPLPKIKVISDDKENASHLLGKTAYYNPADKSITLYTFGRHPKDVLRSFAHEMVHHEQNLNGTLGNIGTTNTNEDGHLEDIEKEAYQKGNIMLRNWEDSIKNV